MISAVGAIVALFVFLQLDDDDDEDDEEDDIKPDGGGGYKKKLQLKEALKNYN